MTPRRDDRHKCCNHYCGPNLLCHDRGCSVRIDKRMWKGSSKRCNPFALGRRIANRRYSSRINRVRKYWSSRIFLVLKQASRGRKGAALRKRIAFASELLKDSGGFVAFQEPEKSIWSSIGNRLFNS